MKKNINIEENLRDKHILVLIFILLTINTVFGLQLQSFNFASEKEYKLYNEWIKFGKIRKNAQTIISQDLFIMDFSIQRSKQQVTVEFDLNDYKVYRSREIIFVNQVSNYQIPNEHLKIL